MKVSVLNQNGEKVEKVDLPSEIFDVEIKKEVLHQAMVTQLTQQRIIGAHVKTRGEVRGGGRKPWRQKGTGRARAGSIRSPLWRGGGVAGRPRQVFGRELPKKQWKKAICMALSDKLKDQKIIIVDKIELKMIKTKEFLNILSSLPIENLGKSKVLIILDDRDERIIKSAANLPFVKVLIYNQLNIVDLLKYDYLIILKNCLKLIERVYKTKR